MFSPRLELKNITTAALQASPALTFSQKSPSGPEEPKIRLDRLRVKHGGERLRRHARFEPVGSLIQKDNGTQSDKSLRDSWYRPWSKTVISQPGTLPREEVSGARHEGLSGLRRGSWQSFREKGGILPVHDIETLATLLARFAAGLENTVRAPMAVFTRVFTRVFATDLVSHGIERDMTIVTQAPRVADKIAEHDRQQGAQEQRDRNFWRQRELHGAGRYHRRVAGRNDQSLSAARRRDKPHLVPALVRSASDPAKDCRCRVTDISGAHHTRDRSLDNKPSPRAGRCDNFGSRIPLEQSFCAL